MEKSRKEKSFIVFTLLMLLLVVIGATYAYFAAQKGTGGSANIDVQAGTTDSLTFQAGNSINITASADDFYLGADDKTGNSTATATLVPNNNTNEATEHYNVYLVIDKNDFTYSTTDKETELLLKIKQPDGEYLTNIPTLKYDTELQGFDITKRRGTYQIALEDEIKATDEKGTSEEWQIEVILKNLPTDQQVNTGKTFSGKVLITTDTKETYVMPEINNIAEGEKTFDTITVNLMENESHTEEIDKYYFAIEETTEEPEMASMMSIAEKLEPTYYPSDTPNYTFKDLKENQNYKIYAYSEDKQGIDSEIKTAIIKTTDYTRATVTDLTVLEKENHSLKVQATANGGTNQVKEYAFKLENAEVYSEWSNWQESNEFTFDNLKAGVNYKIQVKVRDDIGKESITSYDKEETTKPFIVNVEVTGGSSNPSSAEVMEDGTTTFAITANDDYDITTAQVTEGDNCVLSEDNGTLTVSNVTSDKTCKIVLIKKLTVTATVDTKNTDIWTGIAVITVNATGGTGSYNYSVENSCTQCDEVQSQCGSSSNGNVSIQNNIITISDLQVCIEHNFKIKVTDENNKEAIYEIKGIYVKSIETCPTICTGGVI